MKVCNLEVRNPTINGSETDLLLLYEFSLKYLLCMEIFLTNYLLHKFDFLLNLIISYFLGIKISFVFKGTN